MSVTTHGIQCRGYSIVRVDWPLNFIHVAENNVKLPIKHPIQKKSTLKMDRKKQYRIFIGEIKPYKIICNIHLDLISSVT